VAAEAMRDDPSITTLVIGDNIVSIGDGAFRGLSGLTALVIEGDPVVGTYAFWECTIMRFVHMASISHIAPAMLGASFLLRYIELPATVTIIGSGAFNTSALHAVSLPDGLQFIEWVAFNNNSNLLRVNIPPGCTVDIRAFERCAALSVVAHHSQQGMFPDVGEAHYYALIDLDGSVHRTPYGAAADPAVSGGIEWFTDPDCLDPYDWSAPVTSDVTLYASSPSMDGVGDGGDSIPWTMIIAVAAVAVVAAAVVVVFRR